MSRRAKFQRFCFLRAYDLKGFPERGLGLNVVRRCLLKDTNGVRLPWHYLKRH
jgi:hypothetical protein